MTGSEFFSTPEATSTFSSPILSPVVNLSFLSFPSFSFQYSAIWSANTPFKAAARTNPHQSTLSPVSVAVVKTLARHPARELKTRKAESWPVEPRRMLEMIWGSLEERARGMHEAARTRRVERVTRGEERRMEEVMRVKPRVVRRGARFGEEEK